jgi:hypothetical protein
MPESCPLRVYPIPNCPFWLREWQTLDGAPALPVYKSQVSCPGIAQSIGQVAQDSLGSQTPFPHDALNWWHWLVGIPEGHG